MTMADGSVIFAQCRAKLRRIAVICTILSLLIAALYGQNDRGTITGTVSDPAGAVVPNANIKVTNTQTGVVFETTSTTSGDYTISQLPAGEYEISLDVPGFSKFTRTGIRVLGAETARIDVSLTLGSAGQSITVTADASLLKTENAEQSTTMAVEKLDELPLNFGSQGNASSANIRNPYTFVTLVPSATISGNSDITMNGVPSETFRVNIEGQEANNSRNIGRQDQTAPSVESLQEESVETSNFSAEFGQVGGGYFNLVVKSGTNQIHGSGFDYFVNTVFDAGQPFTNNGHGGLIRPPNLRNDFGGTIGGPVYIPKIYDGRNKTFFFFSYEAFLQTQTSTSLASVPTQAMRNGDFSAALTGRQLGTDPLGRPIFENTIYDPLTAVTAPTGQVVTSPFSGNLIPASRMDPVALKIQALLPLPNVPNPGILNNFQQNIVAATTELIPTIKIDQNFRNLGHLSFYWSQYYGPHNNYGDGLPLPITGEHRIFTDSNTFRLNYDQPVTPTFLIHAGIGFLRQHNPDQAFPASLNYNAVQQLGLKGAIENGFPDIAGLISTDGGGMSLPIGAGGGPIYYNKPTSVLTATLVRGSHTFKAGGEYRIDALTTLNIAGLNQGGNGGGLTALYTYSNGTVVWPSPYGSYAFSNAQTGLPYTQGQTLNGGNVGLPYASFLLGAVNAAAIENPSDTQARKPSLSLFIQDNWKITHKITLDYGIRWDYQGYPKELFDRSSEFSPTTPNPAAGGLPGAVIYEGSGPGTCSCMFSHTYPYALGPRLGLAYQVLPKTVLRAGWGITYAQTAMSQDLLPSTIGAGGWNTLNFTNPTYGAAALQLSNGLNYNPASLYAVSYNNGILPQPGQINSPPTWLDPNSGRPGRLEQWDISLQREITPNLMLEAAYVGNRGAYFESDNLININAISSQRLASFGINLNNPAQLALMTMPLNSPQVVAAGFTAPYPGFPTTQTLAQALRPFPQFSTITAQGAPLGDTWYEALQTKLTKRLSHGLDVLGTFVWEKVLDDTDGNVNNVFNRPNQKALASLDQPLAIVVAFTYRAPGFGSNTWVKRVSRNWTFSGILKYASGLPILVPVAQNNLNSVLFQNTYANRVPGQPLFLENLNCGCIDPHKDFVLNPAAWSEPAPGQWGYSAPYYNDYRYTRLPSEQAGFGRIFQIREGLTFQIRAEFFNIFNRVYLNNPTSTNALATQTTSGGVPTSGFGYINPGSVQVAPRSGQIIARFQF